jgi:hypothetical protein
MVTSETLPVWNGREHRDRTGPRPERVQHEFARNYLNKPSSIAAEHRYRSVGSRSRGARLLDSCNRKD